MFNWKYTTEEVAVLVNYKIDIKQIQLLQHHFCDGFKIGGRGV